MDYKEFKELMIDYLSDNLSEEKVAEFEAFLAANSEYKEEFEATQLFWNAEEEIPEPSAAMDVKFYTMLNEEEQKSTKISIFRKIEQLLLGSFPKQLAYTLAVLLVGFFFGNRLFTEKPVVNQDVLQAAKQETADVRSQLVLTLLDQPLASKRLQAVSEVTKLDTVAETIIKALFSTLNNDANVNVRLSAIEALKNYTHIPLVREGLVSSIIHQKSPLVQVELADLMVLLQEKKAVKSFEKLIKEEDVNISAKQKMEQSIQSIY